MTILFDIMSSLVSVVMPVYNGEKYLSEALDSVLSQTYSNWELIVVNDGSSDGSVDIIKKYVAKDSRISLIEQENQGQSKARNVGAQRGNGKYLAFLDQDDRYWPTKLDKQVKYLNRKKYTGMVYSDLDRIDEGGGIFARNALSMWPSPHPKQTIIDCLAYDMFIVPGSVLIRKEVFDSLGGFDVRLSGYEDDDLFLRVFRKSRIAFLKESLLQWRITGDSCSYTERMRKSRMIYFEKLKESFPDDTTLSLYWMRDVLMPRFSAVLLDQMHSAKRRRDYKALKDLRKDFSRVPKRPWKLRFATLLISRWVPNVILNILRKFYRRYMSFF